MKTRVADPKKYLAGWGVVVIALTTSIIGLARDSDSAVLGSLLVAIAGWGIVREAKIQRGKPPHVAWVRWYHLAGVTVVVGATVFWLWWTIFK